MNCRPAAMHNWLAWAVDAGKIETNPVQWIKGVRLTRPESRWLNWKETHTPLRAP